MREFKVVVLGSGGVGKSALTVKFVSGTFVEKYDPTIEDFYRKEIAVDGSPAILEILDTAGTEQFSSMRDLYIRNGQGFIVVYSITSLQTFQDIRSMKEQIIRVKGTDQVGFRLGTKLNPMQKIPLVLVGNKVDLASQREVSTAEGWALANEWNCPFLETSARDTINVNAVFIEVVREMQLSLIKHQSAAFDCCTCSGCTIL